jgi:hypothetical protein
MRHLGCRARFHPEAPANGGVRAQFANHFQRDGAVEALVLRLVHHTHPAFSYLGEDFVWANALGY